MVKIMNVRIEVTGDAVQACGVEGAIRKAIHAAGYATGVIGEPIVLLGGDENLRELVNSYAETDYSVRAMEMGYPGWISLTEGLLYYYDEHSDLKWTDESVIEFDQMALRFSPVREWIDRLLKGGDVDFESWDVGGVSFEQENDEGQNNVSLREQLYLAADAVRDYSRFVIEDHPLLAKHVDLLMRVVAEVQAEPKIQISDSEHAVVNHPYSCGQCGGNDCKLWRPSHVFANEVELICWRCLESKGYTIAYGQPDGSDQVYDREIGHENWVPAVPNLDGSWWGYTSVPCWWCAWWEGLPNHKDDCKLCCGSGKVAEYKCYKCKGSGRQPE